MPVWNSIRFLHGSTHAPDDCTPLCIPNISCCFESFCVCHFLAFIVTDYYLEVKMTDKEAQNVDTLVDYEPSDEENDLSEPPPAESEKDPKTRQEPAAAFPGETDEQRKERLRRSAEKKAAREAKKQAFSELPEKEQRRILEAEAAKDLELSL